MAAYVPSPEEIRDILRRRKGDAEPIPGGREAPPVNKEDMVPELVQAAGISYGASDLRAKLDGLIARYGMEPAEELIRMCAERLANGQYALTPQMRSKILMCLQEYRMPKLKAVEVSGAVEHQHNIVIVRYGEDGQVRREQKVAKVSAVKTLDQHVDVEVVEQ